MFRGICIVTNFFVFKLNARKSIPKIKLLAISKMIELELFCDLILFPPATKGERELNFLL